MTPPTPEGVERRVTFGWGNISHAILTLKPQKKRPGRAGPVSQIQMGEITGRNRAARLRRALAQRRSNAGLRRTG
jgi:hypothetical protein